MRLKVDEFRCLEKQWRISYEVSGSSIFILSDNLNLNEDFKFWNKGVKGYLEVFKASTLVNVSFQDEREGFQPFQKWK